MDIYREIVVQNTGAAAKSTPVALASTPRYSTFEGYKEGQFFFVRKK